VALAIRRRHDHDDFSDTCDLGRQRAHQHARRISSLAARHVNADAIERRDLLAEQRAVFVVIAPRAAASIELALVEAAHAARRSVEGTALRWRDRVERGLQLALRNLQRRDRRCREAIEALRVFEHRRISARANVAQDRIDAFLDREIGLRRPVQHALQLALEIGRRRRELGDVHCHAAAPIAAAKASMMRRMASRLSLSAAWLTTKRAEICMISSTSTRLLAFSVLPVATRSTIASAKP